MEVIIRNAIPADASGIVAIFNPIIEAGVYTVFDTPFTAEEEERYISGLSERAIFQVAVRSEDERIVGFQSMEPFAAYTRAFQHVGVVGTFVDLGHLRRGIARRLFESLFQLAPRKAYEKIFTFIRADNPAALAVYQRYGFRVVGRAERQAKLRGSYLDEIIVERILSPDPNHSLTRPGNSR